MKTKLLSLLFCALLWVSGICSAETMYQVSETDLTQLTMDLTTLSQDNKQLQSNLEISTKDLGALQSQLATLKSELSKYQSLSQTALQFSEETLKSLGETQQSLRKLEAKVGKPRIKLGIEGSVESDIGTLANIKGEVNLRLSKQSEDLDIDIRVNQSKQSISATKWF